MTARRRLTPEDRRRQLVDVGARMFATQSYEIVQMEDVARQAGVSRALLYKHFASKRDLFAAVYQEASDGLLEVTELDPAVPFAEQLTAGLEAHFAYFEANRSAVLAANRVLAGDPTIQAIITGELATLRRRILDISGLTGHDRATLGAILTSWLVFVRALVLEWLTDSPFTRAELLRISIGALTGALGDLAPRIGRVETQG